MDIKSPNINGELKQIIDTYSSAKSKRKEFELGFNAFSIISDTYYKENLHSQIIYALLNPKGEHGERDRFLNLFLDFVKVFPDCNLNKENYTNAKVEIEKPIDGQRRIDILISSNTHAVIIENKINDAVDMDNQLIDYYRYCIQNNHNVDTILYLSLDGIKSPDRNKWDAKEDERKKINGLIIRVPAYDNKLSGKTIYDWLEVCKNKSSIDNNRFIISQYQQLLKSLRGYIMETSELGRYYDLLTKNKSAQSDIETWIEVHNNLIKYYPDKLKDEINNRINKDEKIRSYFVDLKTYGNALIFDFSSNNNYYLKVDFLSNKECDLSIMNNTLGNAEKFDSILKENNFIKEKFYISSFCYKKKDYSLINNFDELVDDIQEILTNISKLIGVAK